MTYRYGYEEIDYVDGTQDWVWNAPQHVFFLRIRKLFDAELCALYTRLESLGAWSATGLINQFNEWQEQFPEELWRLDIDRKYIRTYTSSFINSPARPEFLKERANGRKKTQRAQFEKYQEKYMSSKFGGNVAAADDIIMRCSVPNETLAVTPNFDMHLTPYSHIYLNVKYNTSPPIRVRAVPNTEYTIKYDAELADIIEIYSASCLTSIGDLSACYLTNGDFSNARKIKELKLGNDTSGYRNSNEMTLGLGSNELLTKLDIQNMSGLTSSVDLSTLKNLEELYAFGSNVSGVIFADGGNVFTVEIPEIGSLQMKNLSYLVDSGFDVTSYNNLTRLVAENSKLDLVTLINNAPNLYQVRLVGVDWTLNDTSLLERLYNLAGVTNTGANADRAILTGRVSVPVIRQQQLYDYQREWPDLEVVFNTMIEQYPVTFKNDDGVVLDVQYIDKGADAVDPITRENNPISIPTKESTISTDFTYAGWDIPFTAIFSDRTITATYTESVRSYTIKYVSKGITLQTSVGKYGENVLYEGKIPTYTLEENAYKYFLFKGWDKSGFIDGEKTVNAIFDEFTYVTGAFNGKELKNLKPVEIYALSKLTEPVNTSLKDFGMNIETGDEYSFQMGYDVDYEDIESKLLVSDKIGQDGSTSGISTAFDGTNCWDTGIKLFDVDRDFVLAIDYKIAPESKTGTTLMQCFQSSGSNGFKLNCNGISEFTWGTSSTNAAALNAREMLVIRHKKGENNLTVYTSNLNDIKHNVVFLDKSTSTQSDSATLVFGAAKQDSGRFVNYAVGNVYWCKIWYADLGEKACEQLAGWTHENVSLEVSGFYRYALYDDFTKESMMSLLATHLLDNQMRYNNNNTTTGGWAASWLNKFLNTRFYNAIPLQIKSLVKRVAVKSLVGDMSSGVSESGCYINIPSVYDVNNDFGTPYNSEVYDANGTIDFMTSPEMRKRKHVEGNYSAYWLRSTNVSYNYIYQVDENGETNGFNIPNNNAGVLVEISF